MTLDNILLLVILAVFIVLLGIFIGTRVAGRAPGKLETKVEADAFAVFTNALEALGDTSGEDKVIAAAQQRKQQKQLAMQHAVEAVQAHAVKTAATAP